MHFMNRTNHLICFHCMRRIFNLRKSKPNIKCLKSMTFAYPWPNYKLPDGQRESVFENYKLLWTRNCVLKSVADKHFAQNEFSKNVAVMGYPGFAHALMPVLTKHQMIKPVFVIETEEKQERFQGDLIIPEHMRSTLCNIFKYKLSTFTNGLRKIIQQEHDLLDTLDNISGVTVFCEVHHDLEFVSLLNYRLCKEDGIYEYPVNWFLLMNSAIYEKLLLINKASSKIFFHAVHKCSARKLVSTGSKSMHQVLLHVTPNYELLHQLKVERKFFKVFLSQIGHKKSLILPFVESMVSESTEVVRPLLETQYTRVCDIHPTKLLEIFIALTNMPEFESSMFKQILYTEQWNEPRIEEDKSSRREDSRRQAA